MFIKAALPGRAPCGANPEDALAAAEAASTAGRPRPRPRGAVKAPHVPAALARAARPSRRLPARLRRGGPAPALPGEAASAAGGRGGEGAERSAGARSSAAMEPGVEELMPRLLPVDDCDLAEDFDPTVPPRTPQEYLKRVQ